jgi:hypothetical protein
VSVRLGKNCGRKFFEEHSFINPTAKLDTALNQIGSAMSERSRIKPTKKSNGDADIAGMKGGSRRQG